VDDLDEIIARLEQGRQRATYGAVAKLLGRHYRNLMKDKGCSHRNSWVVNKQTQLPTGYGDSDLHPELLANANGVIETAEELADWLSRRRPSSG